MNCSSRCTANHVCCGVRSTSKAPNSTLLFKIGATPRIRIDRYDMRVRTHVAFPYFNDRTALESKERQTLLVGRLY
jgi:hypothetical protein